VFERPSLAAASCGLRVIRTERPIRTFDLYEQKLCGSEPVNAQSLRYSEVLEPSHCSIWPSSTRRIEPRTALAYGDHPERLIDEVLEAE
jgi:hypothetical protein